MEVAQKPAYSTSIHESLLPLRKRRYANYPTMNDGINTSTTSSSNHYDYTHNNSEPPLNVQPLSMIIDNFLVTFDHPPLKKNRTTPTTNNDLTLSLLVEHLKTKMKYKDVSDVKLILEKKLTDTDVNDSQGRLAIPAKQLLSSFLFPAEDMYLKWKLDNNKNNKMDVKVIVRDSLYTLSLTRWNYHDKNKNKNKNKNDKSDAGWKYVLNNGWTRLKNDNTLKQGDLIKIVSFRSNSVLHFAIICPKSNGPQLFNLFE